MPRSNDRLLYEAPAIVGLSPFYNIEFKAPNAGASLSFWGKSFNELGGFYGE